MRSDRPKPIEQPPHTFARRIVLATVGLNPQVVTETLYALAIGQSPAFVPTEIHIITTAIGARHTRLTLLDPTMAMLARFAQDYNLPQLTDALPAHNIHVIGAANGSGNDDNMASHKDDEPLDDITNPTGNSTTADLINRVTRELTRDETAALHVSIAGGRKTMGVLQGIALSLFGRPQDRLSHVLVAKPFEQHRDFFYPPPEPTVLFTNDRPPRPINTADANIVLANVPFVRLRSGLPHDLLGGKASFSQTVEAAQTAMLAPELVIDLANKRLSCHGVVIGLPPQNLAYYALLARRRLSMTDPDHGFHWYLKDASAQLISSYKALPDLVDGSVSGLRSHLLVKNPAEADRLLRKKLEQLKTLINKTLELHLGQGARPYLITQIGLLPGQSRYKALGLPIPATAIRFDQVAAPAPEDSDDTS